MTELSAPRPTSRRRFASTRSGDFGGLLTALGVAAVVGGGVLVAAVLVIMLDQTQLTAPLVLVGGVAMVAFVLLVVTRLDTAVTIAVALGAVVFVEPSPTDLAFVVILVVATVTGRLKLAEAPAPARIFVAALLVLNLVSMVDAFDVVVALRFAFITTYLAIMGLWMATWVDSERRARLVVLAWLWVGLFSAVIGIIAFNVPVPFRELLLSNQDTRVRGLFKDPNVFGPFLVPIAVIVLEQRIRPRILHLSSFWSAVVVSVLTLGVLFSFSRASWLNMCLAVGVMLLASALTRRGGARAAKTLISLLVVAVVAFGALAATGQLDFLQSRAKLQNYDSDRFSAQHAGYELGWEYPVGVGPGQFQFHHNIEAHSTFVRTLAEQGFGGVIAWIAIALSTLVLAARNALRGVDTYGIGASALLGAWCGLLLNSAVVDTLHWRHLWLVAALIWAGAMREQVQRPTLRSGEGRLAA